MHDYTHTTRDGSNWLMILLHVNIFRFFGKTEICMTDKTQLIPHPLSMPTVNYDAEGIKVQPTKLAGA